MTTNSISFDRAANYYDQTRQLFRTDGDPGPAAHPRSRRAASQDSRSRRRPRGRIGVPRPATRCGLDRLRSFDRDDEQAAPPKFPTVRLAQTNAAQLPFVADRFDAAITIHVLHLVGPWRAALREIKRVLKPGGVYLNSGIWHDGDCAQPQTEKLLARAHRDTRCKLAATGTARARRN